MNWLQNFLDNTIVQAFLAITAVVGFGWGFYTHAYSNRKQRISIAFSAYRIIKQGKNTIEQLSLSFAGKKIHDLTITKFAIWNSGNKVINSADVVSSQQLRVIADENTEILEAQIVTESDSSNGFRISEITDKQVCLDFDYFDSREGIVVQVFHTGTVNSLSIDCKIKGGKPIKKLNANTNKSSHARRTSKKILAVLMTVNIVLALVMLVMCLLIELNVLPKSLLLSPLIMPQNRVFLFILLMIGVVPLAYITIDILRKAFSVGVPTKLKTFENTLEDV